MTVRAVLPAKVLVLVLTALFGTITTLDAQARKPLTNKQVGQYMRKGDKLVAKGDLAEGGRYYYTIVADYPENGEAQLKLARIYKALGEIENAAGAYAAAAEHTVGQEQAEAYVELTEVFATLGKYQEAAVSARRTIAADPSNADAQVYLSASLALSFAKTGQYSSALSEAEKAISLVPDNAMAQASLGIAQLGMGNTQAAEAALNKSLEIDPDLAEAHAGVAEIKLAKEDYEGAVAAATKAIEINKKFTRAYAIRGIANNGRGETEAAFSDLALAVTVDPKSFKANLAFAEVYQAQGNQEMADVYYDKAKQLSPEAAEAVAQAQQKGSAQRDEANQVKLLDLELPGPASSATDCLVSIESFDVRRRQGDYEQEFVQLLLKIRNDGSERVKAWQMTVAIVDVFGEQVVLTKLTEGSASIQPGEFGLTVFGSKDNPFIDDQPYDRLVSYSAENLTIQIKDCKVSVGE